MIEWNNQPTDEEKEENIGAVYIIFNKFRKKYYIGKFLFWTNKKYPPLKGKKRVRRVKKESNWREYLGSSQELLKDIESDGIMNIEKHILCLCKNKSMLNYMELYFQMKYHVLLDDDSYNAIINIRLNHNTLKGVADNIRSLTK